MITETLPPGYSVEVVDGVPMLVRRSNDLGGMSQQEISEKILELARSFKNSTQEKK